MSDRYDDIEDSSAFLIGLLAAAAALSGAVVGVVAGTIGASLCWITWSVQ